mmetsp:Transcript_80662/g.152412  ORF Transcript_80662/g.152412 Transcript_80662/m.152412 type:complete len:483 (+) Transcript_80662:41-1489(+)
MAAFHRVLSCLLFFTDLLDAQIQVMSPRWLTDSLSSTNGRIDGSTATFGAPFYGDRVLGRLVWGESKKGQHHCTDEDYDVPVPDVVHGTSGVDEVRLINVIIVRRGECSFVTKVRVAANKGAHAVIIVDRPDTKLTTSDLKNIVVADDGYGSTIHIPSVLVTRDHGEQLIAAASGSEAVVELAWDVPTGHVVQVDMWMSSGSADSTSFLESFAESRKTLNEVVDFQPHYHVFSMDSTQGGYNGLCSDETAEYCAEDPDKSGPVTGRDVLEEDVRQLCIHEITKVPRTRAGADPSNSAKVFFADAWWNYMKHLSTRCPIEATQEQDRFGVQCSEQLMREVGIDVEKVQKCVRETAHQKLAQERENKAWSPHALRINGWRYSGMLNADLVTRAVCSGFAVRPKECSELIEPRDPFAKFGAAPSAEGVGFGGLMGVLSCLVFAACIGMVLYRRLLAKTIRNQMREEVMLEVHAQLDAYSKLPASV